MMRRGRKTRTTVGTDEAWDKENYCCHEVMLMMMVMLNKRRKRGSRTATTRMDNDNTGENIRSASTEN